MLNLWMSWKKITFLESLQTFLREKIQNHENTISELHRLIDKQKADLVFLKTKLSDENEMTMNHLHQIFSLKEQIAELQKKPKPFFRWLLTGIWTGFSNLCGRFRDHFMRQNIYWKLFYISIFLSLIGRFLEKEPVKKTTETICEICSRKSRYITNQDFVY
ncbi:hypothetical protein B9Z55_007424 [Caenorhabditis nigoni]|uniref:Uncharacterized protein n=2 Tax=Caenorhabditis nigoni TaxID=1611254 RepID=A0A2G5V9J7_9PELO|nr:hypothetical protein B9Z55_007424 [Caenorhabditis nigoni]